MKNNNILKYKYPKHFGKVMMENIIWIYTYNVVEIC
jgi:hypothetical protein